MKLLTISIAGAIPFPTPITLTFPDKRLVAITGSNGSGKSTLLDCVYASFYGDLTKPGGLYSLFKAKDGLIDLTFEQAGHTYRIRRLINGVQRTQKAYLYRDGVPLTEGKQAEFDALIEQILGLSKQAFLASVYSSQTGEGSPLTLNDKEKRGLLSEILNLNQFDAPFALVCDTLADSDKQKTGFLAQREMLQSVVGHVPTLQGERDRLSLELSEAESAIRELEAEAQTQRQAVENAKANAQGLEEITRQIGLLETQIQADDDALKLKEAQIRKNQDELLGKALEIKTAVLTNETCQKNIAVYEVGKAELQTQLSTAEDAHRALLSAITADLGREQQALKVVEDRIREKTKEQDAMKFRVQEIEMQIRGLKGQTETLDQVPCQGMPIHATCPLLANANLAKGELLGHETALPIVAEQLANAYPERDSDMALRETLEHKITRKNQELYKAQAAIPGLDLKAKLTDLDKAIQAERDAIVRLEPLVKLAPLLGGAEERIAEYRQEVEVIKKRLNSHKVAITEWQTKQQAAAVLEETIREAEMDLLLINGKLNFCKSKQQGLIEALAKLDLLLTQAQERDAKLHELEKQLVVVSKRISLLQFLKEGLGPKGAKALLIDSAAPEIGELVNALLAECYGSRFTILIKTLKELQNGELRENLEFSVIDNQTGDEAPIDCKSGGEQQLIREVISLGLFLYGRRLAQTDLRTLIRDEACSSLTPENAVLYVKMLSKACEMADIDQVIFVSHQPDAQAEADAVIEVAGGKVRVVG